MIRLLPFCTLVLVIAGCQKKNRTNPPVTSNLEYAKGFSITQLDNQVEIEVIQPYQAAVSPLKYLLVKGDEPPPASDENTQVIRVPVKSIVCTSTSHIALLDHLNAINLLVGFPTTDFISSEKARTRIDLGLVTDLGMDKDMNIEALVALQPDMVMGYSITGEMMQLAQVKKLGIPVVINAEYLEEHPLGRAEWIKFLAPFLGKEKLADSIFNEIKHAYLEAKSLADGSTVKPTVITGILYGDTWFLPGGENYAAKLFNDASYNYLWGDDPSSGFLKLSFESVYAKGKDADFWIGVGSFNSLTEMNSAEKRYALLRPFTAQEVYTYDVRRGVTNGSEYFELGYSRPDIILKDLIKIAHPELLPNYQLYFHKKLE